MGDWTGVVAKGLTFFGDGAGVAAWPGTNPLRVAVAMGFGTGEVGTEEEGSSVCVLGDEGIEGDKTFVVGDTLGAGDVGNEFEALTVGDFDADGLMFTRGGGANGDLGVDGTGAGGAIGDFGVGGADAGGATGDLGGDVVGAGCATGDLGGAAADAGDDGGGASVEGGEASAGGGGGLGS